MMVNKIWKIIIYFKIISQKKRQPKHNFKQNVNKILTKHKQIFLEILFNRNSKMTK